MIKLSIGSVIELPVGLHCRHVQGNELTVIETPVNVVVESSWPVIAGIGGSNHFEDGHMCSVRALNPDGSYFAEGALLIIALSGSFPPEYILPEKPNMILRRMKRVFLPE